MATKKSNKNNPTRTVTLASGQKLTGSAAQSYGSSSSASAPSTSAYQQQLADIEKQALAIQKQLISASPAKTPAPAPIISSAGRSPIQLAADLQNQVTDLQAQSKALTQYGLADTAELTKDATGKYVPKTSLPNSPVGTSASARLAQLKKDLGIGAPPAILGVSPEDTQSLNLAKQERTAITTEIEGIQSERLALQNDFRQFASQQGKEVTEGGRIGAITEEQRNAQFRLDALNRREAILETKLGNRNTVISEVMQAQRQSYQDAVQQYNQQFTQSVQLYSILEKEDDEMKTNAKSNLDVLTKMYVPLIRSGTQLTGIQKQQLNELDLQAGRPLGYTADIIGVAASIPDYEYKATMGSEAAGYSALFINSAGDVKTVKVAGGTGDNTPLVSDSSLISDSSLMFQAPYSALTAKQKQQADSLNNLVHSLNEYKATYETNPGILMGVAGNLFGADAGLLSTKLNSIIFAAAQAEGTGALQKADREVIEQIIPNPTNLRGALSTLFRGGASGNIARIEDQINKYTRNLGTYGLTPTTPLSDDPVQRAAALQYGARWGADIEEDELRALGYSEEQIQFLKSQ